MSAACDSRGCGWQGIIRGPLVFSFSSQRFGSCSDYVVWGGPGAVVGGSVEEQKGDGEVAPGATNFEAEYTDVTYMYNWALGHA